MKYLILISIKMLIVLTPLLAIIGFILYAIITDFNKPEVGSHSLTERIFNKGDI